MVAQGVAARLPDDVVLRFAAASNAHRVGYYLIPDAEYGIVTDYRGSLAAGSGSWLPRLALGEVGYL